MITKAYRGGRFDASDVPLLATSWQTIDEFDPDHVKISLEVLSGKNYQRQIIQEGLGRELGKTAYLLQVLVTSKVDGLQTWGEICGAMNEPINHLRQQTVAAVGGSMSMISTPGHITPPRNRGVFGSARTEDGVVHIRQPLLRITHEQDDGRIVELRAASIAPIDHFMAEVYPVAFDDNNACTVRVAKKGYVVIPSPEQLRV